MLKSGKPTYSYLFEVLRDCNNIALFLPDVDAHLTFFEFRRNISIKHNVFLSKETMFQLQHMYSFGGWITSTTLNRMKALEVGGFFNRWTDFIGNYMTKIRGGETAGGMKLKTHLSGNISVIFVVLVTGWCFCLIVFALEALMYWIKYCFSDFPSIWKLTLLKNVCALFHYWVYRLKLEC